MYKKNYGGTIAEAISIIVMLAIIILAGIALVIPSSSYVNESSRRKRCVANLTQFRTAFTVYRLDLGRQVYYPQKQGQGFLASLYEESLLLESRVYLCPGTDDTNDIIVRQGTIFYSEVRVEGGQLINPSELGDTDGPISYAGRINSNQNIYPGLFKLTEDTTTTPLISDDFCAPKTSKMKENHLGGQIRGVLFLDGHVDFVRSVHDFININLFDVLKN